MSGLNLVGVDVVEVAPAYDHAEITGIAAAHVVYEALSGWRRARKRGDQPAEDPFRLNFMPCR